MYEIWLNVVDIFLQKFLVVFMENDFISLSIFVQN